MDMPGRDGGDPRGRLVDLVFGTRKAQGRLLRHVLRLVTLPSIRYATPKPRRLTAVSSSSEIAGANLTPIDTPDGVIAPVTEHVSQPARRRRQRDMNNSNDSQRLDLAHHAGSPYAGMLRVEERIDLDERMRGLVKVRASQVNGCAYCIDMHWSDARAAGESEARLAQLAAWHESPLYDDRERAALELTDAMTLVSETHVPDDVWAVAEAHFEPDELANLLFAIAAINLWNRLMVAVRAVPDSTKA